MRIPIEVRGHSMTAHQMQAGASVGQSLQYVFSMQHIKELPSHGDVFIQGGGPNLLGLCPNGKSQPAFRLPGIDSLNEEHAAFEAGVADSADALARQRGFHGIRKSDSMTPGGLQLG